MLCAFVYTLGHFSGHFAKVRDVLMSWGSFPNTSLRVLAAHPIEEFLLEDLLLPVTEANFTHDVSSSAIMSAHEWAQHAYELLITESISMACQWLVFAPTNMYINVPALQQRLTAFDPAEGGFFTVPAQGHMRNNTTRISQETLVVLSNKTLTHMEMHMRRCFTEQPLEPLALGPTLLARCFGTQACHNSRMPTPLSLGVLWQEFILDWDTVSGQVKANHQSMDIVLPERRLRLHRPCCNSRIWLCISKHWL